MSNQRFHLGDILTITTERLLAPSGMEGVYKILSYMTRDSIFTHQIPRVSAQCRPFLCAQFPQLSGPAMDSSISALVAGLEDKPSNAKQICEEWLAAEAAFYGEWHEVERSPADDYTPIDPMTEAVQMFGADNVIALQTEE